MNEQLENNDKYLIIQAGQGNAEAFEVLFNKYSNKIYRFIYYKISNKELAEDFTSQCFLKAWEQISSKKGIKTFQAWMYKTARNLVIDYYRSREKEELPLIYQDESSESNLRINPDSNLEIFELEKILLNLKSEVKEIVILKYIEGFSIKEIAKIVDKSSANVRVIIHRALKDLNKYIDK